MKPKILALLLSLSLCGCDTLTPKQKAIASVVGRGAVTLFQHASDIALRIIISKAVSDEDLTHKANFLDSAAHGLRTLESTSGGIVTAQDVGAIVREFTDPSKVHWADYAEEIALAFERSPLPANEKLEAIAISTNVTAEAARSSQ